MRPAWILASLTLVGCQQIFGLEAPSRGDASLVDAIQSADAGPCLDDSATCAGPDTLRTCSGIGAQPTDTTCGWGCSEGNGNAACRLLVPSGGVLSPPDLVSTMALANVVINATTINRTINTTNGAIAGIRTEGTGLIDGIHFEPRAGGGVFTMRQLTLSASLVAIGARPLVIVALDELTIDGDGTLDLRGTCTTNASGPGGTPGGISGGNAVIGGQGGNDDTSGGGGGGHGGSGGRGGDAGAGQGGDPGSTYGSLAISMLLGGSGGGGGGDQTGGGVGGGGGGAVQLVSNGSIVVSGVINAGGCGGKPGTSADSGGGGGAGGAILLEASSITVHGTLAANGGGGGAGAGGTAGTSGESSRSEAAGGTGLDSDSGGNGAAGVMSIGRPGSSGNLAGGGGGGGIGRIRLNTRSGSAVIGSGSVMSPAIFDGGLTASQGTAAIQ